MSWVRQKFFNFIHGNNLIYNQCWEDPRLDHQALEIQSRDRVMLLTSAGCNSLDYLLSEPERIDAVDVNPRQNALLELKIAGIRELSFEDFFSFFGKGVHPKFRKIYFYHLRPILSEGAKLYWDKHIYFFSPQGFRRSFYYCGTSGWVAQILRYYCKLRGVTALLSQAFEAETLTAQKKIYFEEIKPRFWIDFLRWWGTSWTTMSFLGVPRSQFLQIEESYSGGMAKFIENNFDFVFSEIPLNDNYFYHLYIFGEYSLECCPSYLKKNHFTKLKSLYDRLYIHTMTVSDFLKSSSYPLTKISLLDHMDWLYESSPHEVQVEWQEILRRSCSETRIIWRSASLKSDFIEKIRIQRNGKDNVLVDLLDFNYKKAFDLHQQDRVHTYGSFYVAQPNFH